MVAYLLRKYPEVIFGGDRLDQPRIDVQSSGGDINALIPTTWRSRPSQKSSVPI